MGDYTVKVPEMFRLQITWETCRGGQKHEQFFKLTPEEWNNEHEGFIGLILDEGQYSSFFSPPVRVVFDGLAYVTSITKEQVIAEIGKDVYEQKMQRAEALLTLLNTDPELLAAIKEAEELEEEVCA